MDNKKTQLVDSSGILNLIKRQATFLSVKVRASKLLFLLLTGEFHLLSKK